MGLYVILSALLLFANPFGRLVTLAMRTAGIALLLGNGFGLFETFLLFMLSSTVSTASFYLLLKSGTSRLKQNKWVGGWVEKAQGAGAKLKRVIGGSSSFYGLVGLTIFTCPAYAAAAAIIVKGDDAESISAILAGNALSFGALLFVVEGLRLDWVSTILLVSAVLAALYLVRKIAKKNGK